MALLRWPDTLPRPMRDTYGLAAGENRRFGQNEAGPAQMRGGVSNAPETVTMTLDVSLNERERFWRFWREETMKGLKPFAMRDHARDNIPISTPQGGQLTTVSGSRLVMASWWIVRFGRAVPSHTPIGVRWRVRFDLEVLVQ